MIQLRSRRLLKVLPPVKGESVGSPGTQKVPHSATALGSNIAQAEQSLCSLLSSHVDSGSLNEHVEVGRKKRGRKPKAKCVDFGVCSIKQRKVGVCSVGAKQPPKKTVKKSKPAVSPADSSHVGIDSGGSGQPQKRKRGRKPKAVIEAENKLESTIIVAHKQAENAGGELEGKKAVISQQELLHVDGEKVGSGSCGKAQSRKRGRNPTKQCVLGEATDNGEREHTRDSPKENAKKRHVSTNHTIHVRVHRIIESSAQKERGIPTEHVACDVAKQLSESRGREDGGTKAEEKTATVSNCSKMALRSSRKLCSEPDGMVAEQITQDYRLKTSVCSSDLAPVHIPSVSCVEQDGVQLHSPSSEEETDLCSATDNLSQKIKNPVVKLHKCSNLQKLIHCSELAQTSLTLDTFPGNVPGLQNIHGSCISEPESSITSANRIVNPIEEQSVKGKDKKQSGKILTVKFDFCKKVKKITPSPDRGGVSKVRAFECMAEEQKLKGLDKDVDLKNAKMSSKCMDRLEILIGDLNNNNEKEVAEQNLVDESGAQNPTGSLCKDISLKHDQSCPKSPQNTLKGEMCNNESLDLKCPSPEMPVKKPEITCYPPAIHTVESLVTNECMEALVEECHLVSCQRAIPFSGKHIWKCSCARTSIWTFPRKIKSSVEGTDRFGLDSKSSLEIYCQDVKNPLENHAPTNSFKRVEDTEMVCKKRCLEKTPSVESKISKYDSCTIKHENNEMVSNVLSCREETAISSAVSTFDIPVCAVGNENEPKIDNPSLEDVSTVPSEQTCCNQPLSGVQNQTEELTSYIESERKTSRAKTSSQTHSKILSCTNSENGELNSPRSGKYRKWKNETDLEPRSCTDLKTRRVTPDVLKNDMVPNNNLSISHPSDLHQIIKVFKSPNFKIPLRKLKEETNCRSSWTVDAKPTYSEEPSTNLQMMEIMQKNLLKEFSASSVSLSPSYRPAFPYELPNSSNERLHRPSQDYNGFASTSHKAFSSDFEEILQLKIHSSNEYAETDLHDTLDDTYVNQSWVKAGKSPARRKTTEHNVPDVLKAYEDDILVIDVLQDDPDLFGCASGENSTSPEQSRLLCARISPHTNQSSLVLKQETSPKVSKSCIRLLESPSKNCEDFVTQIVDSNQTSLNKCNTLIKEPEEQVHFGKIAESEDRLEQFNFESKLDLKDRECQDNCASRLLKLEDSARSSPKFQPPELPAQTESQLTHRKQPWTYDCKQIDNPMPTPDMMHPDHYEKWKLDHNPSFQQNMEQSQLPVGYCKFFFNTFRGCCRNACSFYHIPQEYDEKLCMQLLTKLVNGNHIFLLRRAVWVFCRYYQLFSPSVHYDAEILTKLLHPLIQWRLWQDAFDLLETCITANILPSVDIVIKLFEKLASAGFTAAVPILLGIFCKLVESGLILLPIQIYRIITSMEQLQASKHDIGVLLETTSRCRVQFSNSDQLCDVMLVIADIERCKETCDWVKLGNLFLNACRGCESLASLRKILRFVIDALTDFTDDHSDAPYCVFADTVYKEPRGEEVDQNALGRIGISVIYHYHRNSLWTKGKQVLLKLRDLNIQFTLLNGTMGPESQATRCQVVNTATEIFLKCGHLNDAVWVLKASGWTINSPASPCDRMDVLTRHNLLCGIAQETLSKNMFSQCFEVLQHLPGLHDTQPGVDVSQYTIIFNKLLGSCIENKSLGISSSIADFLVSKTIPINFFFLRELITVLGQSCLWQRARAHYKCAFLLGCYPTLKGNPYHKVLNIPCYLSDIEMLLSIEMFMVSNAVSIQAPGGSNQSLQIVLKRNEDKTQHKDTYHLATERLFQATRLSAPKLFIMHMTVNNCNEQVYILDHKNALKWLNENMKWASKAWLLQ